MPSKSNTTATKEESKPTLIPKLRFPEFKGQKGWEPRTIGHFLTESRVIGNRGDTARKITVKLWGNGVVEKNESLLGSSNTQYYRRSSGQFIYSKLDFLNQAFGIVPEHLDGYETTIDLPCFDIHHDLDADFLLEYVMRQSFYLHIGLNADGSRKAKRIHSNTFLNSEIYVPVITEQRKISNLISNIDNLISSQARKVDLLKKYKKGLLQQLFPREGETEPRLRFPEFRGTGAWEERTLADIAHISSGTTPLRSNPEFFIGGTIPWVKTTDLNNSYITKTEEYITPSARARVNPVGSVLVAMYGGFNQIGRTGCLSIPAATNQALSVLALDPTRALPPYVLTWLNAKVDDWKRIASSSRKDPNITGKDVAMFPIALPSITEQHRIATCLSSLDNLIASQTQKLEVLKSYKRGMMQGLFPVVPSHQN